MAARTSSSEKSLSSACLLPVISSPDMLSLTRSAPWATLRRTCLRISSGPSANAVMPSTSSPPVTAISVGVAQAGPEELPAAVDDAHTLARQVPAAAPDVGDALAAHEDLAVERLAAAGGEDTDVGEQDRGAR
ncbi:hypothetical protein ABTY61_39085 [Kitasatospora sp. NPDC096128]|uniref:hypothetical protein n=1 Tax=Kitasatospora sp. NPDC096128 TaxID=3155547 RepID=UPI0033220B6E